MAFKPRNGKLKVHGAQMDYIRFGTGKQTLVMLPGLGDGLRSVKGTAVPMAWMYRCFARDFTVYVFSRKEPLQQGCTTRDMANDQARAMEILGLTDAMVLGVSMGGMIAQHLAADHPQLVKKLILAVTVSEPNDILTESVTEWVSLARAGDHAGFMDSNLRRIYSDGYYRKNKWLTPLVGRLTKPSSYDRFFIQANACMSHDARDRLSRIQVPTLVIGGEQDRTLGSEASKELAKGIPGAKLLMYPQWGHGLYEEAKDFNSRVKNFFMEGDADGFSFG